MSYTFDGVKAEVEYRRSQLLTSASTSRRVWRLRRRDASQVTRELVRDGTNSRAYDLAA